MSLFRLPTARLGLEFEQGEFDTVQSGLRRAARRRRTTPQIVRLRGGNHDILEVGGVRLVLMVDDGDPCLVALSPRGDVYLRDVASFATATDRSARGSASRSRRIGSTVAA